jgi:Malectin domain
LLAPIENPNFNTLRVDMMSKKKSILKSSKTPHRVLLFYLSSLLFFSSALAFESSAAAAKNVGVVLYRLNAGSDTPFTDTDGNVWEADAKYIAKEDGDKTTHNSMVVSSSRATTSIQGVTTLTKQQQNHSNSSYSSSINERISHLYNTARQGDATTSEQLVYIFPVCGNMSSSSSSTFVVRLYFAELEYNTVGGRIFDVDINGNPFLTNYDIIIAQQGASSQNNTQNPAVVEEFELVSSLPMREIKIEFKAVVSAPIVNAIEILEHQMTPLSPAAVVATTSSFRALQTTTQSSSSPAKWITTVAHEPNIGNHEGCFTMLPSNKKAYLIGGREYRNTCAYDPTVQKWDCSLKKPPILLHHMQCVAVRDEIYIPSSWTGTYPYETNVPDIYIFKPSTNTWRTEPGMTSARLRGAAAAAYLHPYIYVSHGNRGGHGKHSTSLTYFDKYHVDTKVWTALPNATYKRDHTGGGIVKGNKMFCVAAGRDGSVGGINKVVLPTECYDLTAANTGWSVRANIPGIGRSGAAYGTTCNGRLMVAGGEGFKKAWNNVTSFDGTSWTILPNLQQARHGTGLAVSCDCYQIHIATGSPRAGGGMVNSTETLFWDGANKPCRPS